SNAMYLPRDICIVLCSPPLSPDDTHHEFHSQDNCAASRSFCNTPTTATITGVASGIGHRARCRPRRYRQSVRYRHPQHKQLQEQHEVTEIFLNAHTLRNSAQNPDEIRKHSQTALTKALSNRV